MSSAEDPALRVGSSCLVRRLLRSRAARLRAHQRHRQPDAGPPGLRLLRHRHHRDDADRSDRPAGSAPLRTARGGSTRAHRHRGAGQPQARGARGLAGDPSAGERHQRGRDLRDHRRRERPDPVGGLARDRVAGAARRPAEDLGQLPARLRGGQVRQPAGGPVRRRDRLLPAGGVPRAHLVARARLGTAGSHRRRRARVRGSCLDRPVTRRPALAPHRHRATTTDGGRDGGAAPGLAVHQQPDRDLPELHDRAVALRTRPVQRRDVQLRRGATARHDARHPADLAAGRLRTGHLQAPHPRRRQPAARTCSAAGRASPPRARPCSGSRCCCSRQRSSP